MPDNLSDLHNEQQRFAKMTFAEAAPVWLAIHGRYIAARTLKDYNQYIRQLTSYFGSKKLDEITISDVRDYQQYRKVVPTLVNAECSCLQQILKEANLWRFIAPLYKPLRVSSKGSGHSINHEQQEELLALAFSRPRWTLAANCLQ